MAPKIQMFIGNNAVARPKLQFNSTIGNANANINTYTNVNMINNTAFMPLLGLNSSMIDRISRTKSGCGACGK